LAHFVKGFVPFSLKSELESVPDVLFTPPGQSSARWEKRRLHGQVHRWRGKPVQWNLQEFLLGALDLVNEVEF
jgi:hypothetical protein